MQSKLYFCIGHIQNKYNNINVRLIKISQWLYSNSMAGTNVHKIKMRNILDISYM